MNKRVTMYVFLFFSIFLLLMVSATAVTINSVTVSDADVFYSNYTGNNVVHLVVNVTGVNSSSAPVVTANFVDFEVNGVSPCPIISLINSDGDIWTGSCDIGAGAGALAANSFKSGKVLVIANETYGTSNSNSDLTIAIYNVGIPTPVNNCYKFDTGSTNFNQVTNFNNMDITLVVQANDGACVAQGYDWNTGWLTVGELKFTSVNFGNSIVNAQKITNLSDIVKLKFSSSKTYQNTKLTVDTVQLPALDVNSLNVKLYHLSLLSPKNEFINSTVQPPSSLIYWTSHDFDPDMQDYTYNLEFTVGQGFKGATITDNVLPNIISYSPSINQVFNTTNITFNALVDGTGTAISKTLFIIDSVSNTANCVAIVSNPEQYNCSLTLPQTDGLHNLSIAAYDFGGDSGNVKQYNLSYTVQMGAPTLSITTPTNGSTYAETAGSMLNLKFGATDGNGVSACWYSLTGPVNVTDTIISNCNNNNTLQLYLSKGIYNLILSANDTTGMISNTNISFTVTDTTAPVMTNTTVVPNSIKAVLSLTTDESATCKYDTIDLAYSEMRNNFNNNILTHTANLTLVKDKLYDYYVRCLDLSNNADTASLYVTLLYGNSTTTTQNTTQPKGDPTVTYNLGVLSVGTKVVGVDKLGVPILNLIIMTNKVASDVSLKITAVSKPEETYSEKVYKYVTIEHDALSDDSVSDVKIKFTVDKSWLTENKINKNDIVLLRYTTEWIPLNTTLQLDENGSTVIYYLADSPGLSLFAISKKSQAMVNASVVLAAANNISNNNTGNATSKDTILLSKRPINWFWVIVISIIVFIVLVLFVMVKKNDEANPPIFPEDRTPWGRVKRLFK